MLVSVARASPASTVSKRIPFAAQPGNSTGGKATPTLPSRAQLNQLQAAATCSACGRICRCSPQPESPKAHPRLHTTPAAHLHCPYGPTIACRCYTVAPAHAAAPTPGYRLSCTRAASASVAHAAPRAHLLGPCPISPLRCRRPYPCLQAAQCLTTSRTRCHVWHSGHRYQPTPMLRPLSASNPLLSRPHGKRQHSPCAHAGSHRRQSFPRHTLCPAPH